MCGNVRVTITTCVICCAVIDCIKEHRQRDLKARERNGGSEREERGGERERERERIVHVNCMSMCLVWAGVVGCMDFISSTFSVGT